MVAFLKRSIAISCLLLVTGCVTDELVVYEDAALGKKPMKAMLGVHKVEKWAGDMKPTEVEVTEKGGKYSFAYTIGDKKVNVNFKISKVPNSKKKLQLVSLPAQKDTNDANMFFLHKRQKGKSNIWVVFNNMPVAKGELEFTNGKAKAEDVKKFLAKKGDEFIAANKPVITLAKAKKK